MRFNTSTLGYKLLSGKLKESRKHSEQLGKYLAGYIDGDGCISIDFRRKANGYYLLRIRFHLISGMTVDCDGSLLRALRDFYDLGITYSRETENNPVTYWECGIKDTKILFNRIGKHLRLKGTHWDNMIWLYEELKGEDLTEEHVLELKEFTVCSRKNSKWLKHPKHPSWAWVAGLIDSDGTIQFSERSRRGRIQRDLNVAVALTQDHKHVLDFLRSTFKGGIHYQKSSNSFRWRRSLGKKNEAFALPFLKQLRKYSCIPHKYSRIDKMIKFHEENKSQRLSVKHSNE